MSIKDLAILSAKPFSTGGEGEDYFLKAEKHALRQWRYYVYPKIRNFNFHTCVEIASVVSSFLCMNLF